MIEWVDGDGETKKAETLRTPWKATPRTMPPMVVKSGRSLWSKSMNEPTIMRAIQIHITRSSRLGPP